MTRLAVLASGTGSLLQAMIDQNLPIALMLADKPCPALEIAQTAGLDTALIERKDFGYRKGIGEDWDRYAFSMAVAETLVRSDIDLAALAGFFTILSEVFFAVFPGNTLNIHPALLPTFPGEFAVRDTLAAGVSQTGSTIHIATEVIDDPRYIVDQVTGVPVYPQTDTVDTLWERIKQQERPFYVRTLQAILSGKIDLTKIKES